MDDKKVFDTLNALNVNGHTEGKRVGGRELTYLSWTWAWAEVKKLYPNAHYDVWRDDKGLPYVYDERTGFMVFTSTTIENVTHAMWLPVMDGANKAMLDHSYEYDTKYGKKTCEAASMFDINKTIMRCLVKNLAMFGLGLYIYAGEDLPEGDDSGEKKPSDSKKPTQSDNTKLICEACGKEIPSVMGNDGIMRTPEKVVEFSKRVTHKRLCWDCAKKFIDATSTEIR